MHYRALKQKVTQDTYTLNETELLMKMAKELKAVEPQTITWDRTTTKRDIHTNKTTKQTSPSKESYAAATAR